MTDVLRHKLMGQRIIPRVVLERGRADERRDALDRAIGQDAGVLIAQRYPPTVETDDDGNEQHTLAVYVFSPEELAAFVAQVREQAMDEFLAVANDTIEQENDDEQ